MITVLLILVVIALVLCPALFKQNQKQLATARIILSVAALTLFVLRFTTCSNAPPPYGEETYNRYWTVGWRLGGLVATTSPEGGRVHFLQSTPRSPGMQTMNESQLEGFEAGAGKVKFEILVRQPASRGPMDLGDEVADAPTMSECLEEAKGAQALVSFINLPLRGDVLEDLPPTFLMDDFSTGYWLAAMKSGKVLGAVTPHLDPALIDFEKEKGPPPERFDAIFRLFTPENVDEFRRPNMN